jgi:N-hydroxyarylamine O-acetyltransferase
MTTFNINLPAYLDRVGLAGNDRYGTINAIPADLTTLADLQLAHMKTITFENLDVVAKHTISMRSEDVQEKLVARKRGGYCFEQNTLMQDVLRYVGFSVEPMLARVRWMKPDNVRTTYTHMVLIVRVPGVEGDYLVDVGFGGIGPLSPIRVDITEPQQALDNKYRVLPCGEYSNSPVSNFKLLQWHLTDKWTDMFAIKFEPADFVDLELSNWWSCTYPAARFPTSLFVGLLIDQDRHFILNESYCVRKPDGSITREPVSDYAHFCELLVNVFKLPVPEGPEFEAGAKKYLTPPTNA